MDDTKKTKAELEQEIEELRAKAKKLEEDNQGLQERLDAKEEGGETGDDIADAATPDDYLNEKVPFRAFKDNEKYKDDIVVIVNGKAWQIQRGVQVMIPRFVYLAIEDAERQKSDAASHSQNLANEYAKKEHEFV